MEAVQALICAQPWPCEAALRVAECESGFDPAAIDQTRENFGLYQVNEHGDGVADGLGFDGWLPYFGEERWARVLTAEENIAMAVEIWERAGRTFGPWSCRP